MEHCGQAQTVNETSRQGVAFLVGSPPPSLVRRRRLKVKQFRKHPAFLFAKQEAEKQKAGSANVGVHLACRA
jgi:hypothetical protein